MTDKKKSPFDFVSSIHKKNEYFEDMQGFNDYVVTQALSSNPNNIHAINAINLKNAHKLSARARYDYYYNLLPKTNKFHSYPKNIKIDGILKLLQEYFGINENVAKSYLELLEPDEIEYIELLYSDPCK